MKILIITPYVPWPLYGGTSVRIFNLMNKLSNKGHEFFLLAGSEIYQNPLLAEPLRKICKKIYLFKLTPQTPISSVLSKYPYPVMKFKTESLIDQLSKIIDSEAFDLIWINLSVLAGAMPFSLFKSTPIYLDHPECEEFVYKDYFSKGSIAEKFFAIINLIKLNKFHQKIFSNTGLISCVSKDEADFTKKQVSKNTKVFIVPNGVDVDFFSPNFRQKQKKNLIIFCGNMSVRRNVSAATFFAKNIFPKIRAEIIDARFLIVGSNPVKEIYDLKSIDGVDVIGEVDDIRDYYKIGKIFVAPYHFGAGTKLKIFEAMASGIPIVSTSLGCRGINVKNNKNIIIAEDKDGFYKAVVKLIRDDIFSKKLAINARRLVINEYSWDNIAKDLESKLLNFLKNK